MTNKHTHGPWKATINEGTAGFDYRINNYDGDAIALVQAGDELIPNAHLIAAAPELLEALGFTLGALYGVEGTEDIQDLARSAIKKAKGEA